MRGFSIALSILLAHTAAEHPSDTSPASEFAPAIFQDVLLSGNNGTAVGDGDKARTTLGPGGFDLMARQQGNCAAGYNTCTTNSAACCGTASYCSNDGNGNLACCKTGASCTGTANYAVATTVVSTFTTTSAGVIVVITTTLSVTSFATTSAHIGVSTIPNTFFAFPSYGTSFDNSAQCTSAYSACTSNYEVCTSQLEGSIGSGFGVTVSDGSGGGITGGAAGVTLAPSAASSVCASLAGQACPGTSGSCSIFGTSGGSFVIGSSNGAGGARKTAAVGMMVAGGVAAGWVL